MKLTFDRKIKFSPIINKNKPLLIQNKLYTQYDNTIVVTDTVDCKILDRISFESISCFTVQNDTLYIANTAITVYSLSEKKIVETLNVGKILINNIAVENDIYISCIDGTVKKIVQGCAVKLTLFDNTIKDLIIKEKKVLAYDETTVRLLSGSKVDIEVNKDNITGVDYDSKIYIATSDGNVYSNDILVIETGKQLRGLFLADDKVVVCDNESLYVYSKEFELIKSTNFINIQKMDTMIETYSNDSNLDEESLTSNEKDSDESSSNNKEDGNSSDSLSNESSDTKAEVETESLSCNNAVDSNFLIEYMSKDLIYSNQNHIFFLSNEFTVNNIILANVDEITSMKTLENLIIIASSSDMIFYTYRDYYDLGEYVFRGFLLAGHSDVVMSIDLKDNIMVSTSRDSRAIVWDIFDVESEIKRTKDFSKKHEFTIKEVFECGESGQNTCAIADNFFVVGGDDGIIQFFNFSENYITKKIHNKEINCLLACDKRKIIISASQDKEIKILDYDSRILNTLSGHRKGVISLALGSKYLASCSLDKTIRLWDLSTWECVSVLEGHDSGVLSTVFYKNDIISSSITGGLKIWNCKNKKCESNLVFPSKIWSMVVNQDEVLVGSSEHLIILKDETNIKSLEILENETKMAKQKIQVDKCLQENNYEELLVLLKDTKDSKLLFNTISKVIGNNINSLEVLSKKQIYKVLQTNQKFKNCLTNNLILQYLFDTKQFGSKEIMNEVEKRTRKEFGGINLIYKKLLSYDIFTDRNKRI